MEYVTLNNGVKMPIFGYSVYQVTKDECERCVLDALEVGYRAIDTAQSYFNEEEVGAAIQKSGVKRGDIFLTTKVWIEHYGYEAAKRSVLESMEKLRTDYLDLVLLHQPFADYYGAYRALEELYGEGRGGLFENETLKAIGAKYGKTTAQVMLRWHIQRGVVVIPKSTHKERMAENLNVFDFALSAEDMAAIAALDKNESSFFSHYDPAMVEWFVNMVEERKKNKDCSKEKESW